MTNEQKPSLTCQHNVLARLCPHCEVEELERELKPYKILALRNYSGLKASGMCSRHQYPKLPDNAECEICYPEWPKLVAAHNDLKQKAWAEIKQLESRLSRYDDDRPINKEWCWSNCSDWGQTADSEWHVFYFESESMTIEVCFFGITAMPKVILVKGKRLVLDHIQKIDQLAHLLDALGIGGGGDTNSNEGE